MIYYFQILIWIFGKYVDGEEVYIKLKIAESRGE